MSWLRWRDKGDKGGGGGRVRSPGSRSGSPGPAEKTGSDLLERIPGISKKNEDGTLFEAPFHAPPDGRNVGVRVFLPRDYPRERPVIQLLQPVAHVWVNQYMQVDGHPEMAQWRGPYSRSLAEIVLDIQREFMVQCTGGSGSGSGSGSYHHPPAPLSLGSPPPYGPSAAVTARPEAGGGATAADRLRGPHGGWGVGGGGSSGHVSGSGPWQAYANSAAMGTGGGAAASFSPAVVAMPVSSPLVNPAFDGNAHFGREVGLPHPAERQPKKEEHHTPIPAIPSSFEELEGMSHSNINRLLDDDVARQVFVRSLPSVVGFTEIRDQLLEENAQTARENIEAREKVSNLKAAASDLRAALQAGCAEHAALVERYHPLGGCDSSDQTLLKAIMQEKKEADRESELLAERFLGGAPAGDPGDSSGGGGGGGGGAGEGIGRRDYLSFMEEYLTARQKYHTIAAKVEALKRGMEGF